MHLNEYNWEEPESLLTTCILIPHPWNQYYISCKACGVQPLNSSLYPISYNCTCKYLPIVSLFTSETVEHWPCMACGVSASLFIRKALLKLLFKNKLENVLCSFLVLECKMNYISFFFVKSPCLLINVH